MERPSRLAVLAVSVGAIACTGEDSARPPRAGICNDAGCVLPPVTTGGGGATDAGRADAPADTGADAAATTAAGTVVTFVDLGLAQTVPVTTVTLTVRFDAPGGGSVTGTTSDGAFSVAGAEAATAAWAAVVPSAAAADWSTTFSLVDTAAGDEVEPLVVRDSLVETILAVGQLTTTRTSVDAVVLLQLVDAAGGQPISGARVVRHGGDALLYADSGTWSGLGAETDASGWVLLLNVPALSGGAEAVTVAGPTGVERVVVVRTAPGGVTVAGAAVE